LNNKIIFARIYIEIWIVIKKKKKGKKIKKKKGKKIQSKEFIVFFCWEKNNI